MRLLSSIFAASISAALTLGANGAVTGLINTGTDGAGNQFISAVPEPSTYFAGAFAALLGLGGVRGLRNRKQVAGGFAALAAAVLGVSDHLHAAVYDPAADFSLNSNPNGVWSYGYSATLGGAMTLHQNHSSNGQGVGLETWNTPRGVNYPEAPGVYYNPTDSTIIWDLLPTGYSVWKPHELSSLAPGGTVIRKGVVSEKYTRGDTSGSLGSF